MTLTLLDYLKHRKGETICVVDSDYDGEFYFEYGDDMDKWDRAMNKIASKLTIEEFCTNGAVKVKLGNLIQKHMNQIIKADIFNSNDVDDIMNDMTEILAGYVSEKWLEKFANCLD